ncbi:MAG: acyl carrier protein [Planctomycetaceae bacterium]|nr:acyl carrier protein [Planctomycetaceae bacterium]
MEQRLLTFISNEFSPDEQSLAADDDLLTSGLIDSLGVMRLVSFIESEFSVTVPPQDVTLENFATVSSIARYVTNRVSGIGREQERP